MGEDPGMHTRVPDGSNRPHTVIASALSVLRGATGMRVLALLLTLACCAFIACCRLAIRMNIVCTHFAYVPIVLTGVRWGKKCVWVAAFIGVFIVCLKPFAPAPEPLAADLARAFFFIAVAFCVGSVSDRTHTARKAEHESRRKLEVARQRLIESERLASMGQLSAGVAHEINNPLGTVLLYSHLVLKQLRSGDPKRDDLQMIVSEATRCKNIVRGLLDFARQSRVSKAPTDLAALIAEVLSIAAPHAKQAGVRLASDVPHDLPTMLIDGTQIRQMLVNLVQNGIDAVSDDGEVLIAARLGPDPESVQIKVSDNGCGIPEKDLSRLFAPFFTTKEMGKGTGLGLAIAYGVVKMHSGDITAESEKGKGATFTVTLPIGERLDPQIQQIQTRDSD